MTALALWPAGWAYDAVGRIRRQLTRPWRAPVPVICIGNLVAGGSGKTPVAIAIAQALIAEGHKPHFLSRGYGGSASGPLRVDLSRHTAADVGDEPLLLTQLAPVWVGADRAASAKAAIGDGADCLVMDDGFQNPTLAKTRSVIVIDGEYGIGNGFVLPAGALRENSVRGFRRADAVIVIGEDRQGIADTTPLPLYRTALAPTKDTDIGQGPVAAFAGIGRPEKFFSTLRDMGCDVVLEKSFPDHHPFSEAEIREFMDQAKALGARAVTTEKDFTRLPVSVRDDIDVLPVSITWEDGTAPAKLLDGVFSDG